MTDLVKVTRALISVSDKSGLDALAPVLMARGIDVLSTGGTAQKLRDLGVTVTDVAEYTGSPEMLGGRVKSLHPKIHGGLLALRGDAAHDKDVADNNIKPIDLVVCNLYPFEKTVSAGKQFEECIENIDIGGPSMVRSAAKNHRSVVVLTSPQQYATFLGELESNDGATTGTFRRNSAAAAFARTCEYDNAISSWFAQQIKEDVDDVATANAAVTTRNYDYEFKLKYGCNPHQLPASIQSIRGGRLPFEKVNGSPGYINLLDALNAWQLVIELREALNVPAAASFKHVSPAGAAVGVDLSPALRTAYEIADDAQLTPLALAYIRARNADPMSSFGDFIALSDVVDEATAKVIKPTVSDGVIAPGFTPEALALLSSKKGGNYVMLKADPSYVCPENELKEVFGVGFQQRRNDAGISPDSLSKVVTSKTDLPDGAKRDLVLAAITLKYTQSNSVGYALDGQMVGVGAGQQSRVDCTKLAGRKVETWYLRQHSKVSSLPFKDTVKKQARVNARVRYIEGDFTDAERTAWLENFTAEPEPLTDAEKAEFLAGLTGVALASDAFFPFRDNIDQASKRGVSYIVQPGGSTNDEDVTKACNEYGMAMAHTNTRLFHH